MKKNVEKSKKSKISSPKNKNNKPLRLALLTGGGDCPGLNACIRELVLLSQNRFELYGVYDAFKGLSEGRLKKLELSDTAGILTRGGTILRSSRFNPFAQKGAILKCLATLKKFKIDGLIVIGGDGTLSIAHDLHDKHSIPVIGIPKTIDNDVYGTDLTIGFMTAVQTVVDALDKLHTTAESHGIVMVVEVMGRHCGYLALQAGIAGGADCILIPEEKTKLSDIIRVVKERQALGKNHSIIVVAEDARVYDSDMSVLVEMPTDKDDYGRIKISGIGDKVCQLLRERLGVETRYTVLGHIQRGGTPVASDRFMAIQMARKASDLACKGDWNRLVATSDGGIVAPSIKVVRKGKKNALKNTKMMMGT